MKRIVILIGILALVFGSFYSYAQEDYSRQERLLFQRFQAANKFLEKGKEYFLKNDLNKAEKELKKCLEKMPEQAEAYFILAQISYKKKELDKSLEEIIKAKENYKFIAKMKINLEQQHILKLQKQKEEAEERLFNLKESLPLLSGQEKNRLQGEIGKVESEVARIENLLSKPLPSEEHVPADYYYVHGNIMFMQKKLQDAHDQYQEAIRLDPKHGNAYTNLANIFFMAKQYQNALDVLTLAEQNEAKINLELKKAVLKELNK